MHVPDGTLQKHGDELCGLADRACRAEHGLRIVLGELGMAESEIKDMLAITRDGNKFEEFKIKTKVLCTRISSIEADRFSWQGWF